MPYAVELTDAAVEGLAELDKGDQKQVYKRLKKLEDAPELSQPLGNKAGIDLTGWRKLTVCNRRVRIIYRIEEPAFVRVVVIGRREDMEVYRLAVGEIKRLGPTP
jgi:mRNA interferase RelE/StbE